MRDTVIETVGPAQVDPAAGTRVRRGDWFVPGPRWAWILIASLFLIIYARDAGRGFVSDDFAWITHGRLDDRGSVTRIFTTSLGFYRPLTSLSFGVNHAWFEMHPKGYGATNLALALAVAVLLGVLAATLGASPPVSAIAAALWLFNFHGVNMSVLWLSGRTSLLLTLWSIAALVSLLRGRAALGAGFAMLAMLSKEEAVVLPVMATIWMWAEHWLGIHPRRVGLRSVLFVWMALAVYLGLRAGSGAYWPHSAPAFYSLTFGPGSVARNIAEYADRALTFSLVALLATVLYARRWLRVRDLSTPAVTFGLLWFACGFALTVFLPVRSSLYVLYPSIGSCLVIATFIGILCDQLPVARAHRLIVLAAATIVILIPVYWSRNARWTELADLSTSAIAELHQAGDHLPAGTKVAILDDESTRVNLGTAWGNMTSEMATLSLGGRLNVSVHKRPGTIARDASTVVVRLEHGRLVGWPFDPGD